MGHAFTMKESCWLSQQKHGDVDKASEPKAGPEGAKDKRRRCKGSGPFGRHNRIGQRFRVFLDQALKAALQRVARDSSELKTNLLRKWRRIGQFRAVVWSRAFF